MARIKIEQLDAEGEVFRTFEQFPTEEQVPERLERIAYAYCLEHTRVSVDGVVVPLTREKVA